MIDEEKRLSFILRTLLHLSNYLLEKDVIETELLSNPSFPKTKAIIHIFKKFNINYYQKQNHPNSIVLANIPPVFLTNITDAYENQYLVLIRKRNENFEMIFNSSDTKTFTENQFLQLWSGLSIEIEQNKETILQRSTITTIKDFFAKNIPYFLMLMFVGLYLFNTNPDPITFLHLASSIIGLGFSMLIAARVYGLNSKAQKFCSNTETCLDVIKSDGSNIYKGFKLVDLSLIYFSTLTLFWSLGISKENNYSTIILLGILTLPTITYSTYYQKYVVKKWCLLCLRIISVLLVQIALAIFLLFAKPNFSINQSSLVVLLLLGCSTLILWEIVKSFIKGYQKNKELKFKYFRFKRNLTFFNALLHSRPKIATAIDGIDEISLGNKTASLKIVFTTNPICSHCEKVYHVITEVLEKYRNDVHIIIRYRLFGHEKNRLEYILANILLSTYFNLGPEAYKKKVLELFYAKDHSKFTEENMTEMNFSTILTRQKEWCKNNNILNTPTLIINGRLYPTDYYEFEYLHRFMDDLILNTTTKAT